MIQERPVARPSSIPARLLALAALAAFAAFAALGAAACAPDGDAATAARFAALYEERAAGVEVEGSGRVVRRLSDDLVGSRHQRWIVRLEGGQTLLISHNIDVAPRVRAGPGDVLEFRGVYEWNAQGGVVHWTHRDPAGRRAGGWLRRR